MSYTDEQVIKLRNEYKAQLKKGENNELICQGQTIHLKEFQFFNDRLFIMLPSFFGPLDPKSVEIKYPSNHRPPIILSEKSESINFTLNLLQQPLSNEHVREVAKFFKQIIRKTNPANVFFSEDVITAQECEIAYFEYKSYAIDQDVYNLVYVLPIDHLTLLGTFNCRFVDSKTWQPIVVEVLKTCKDLSLKKAGEKR